MSDPLALLPFALAAGGGSINGFSTVQLVAAGVTLLQRSAPLVRSLSGRRSAIVLETGPAWVLALAASDGRGALLVSPDASAGIVADLLHRANVGAVFTVEENRHVLPPGFPVVLLDDSPRTALVCVGDRRDIVDLGSHHGLDLQGESNVDGAGEECLVTWGANVELGAALESASHRDVLQRARRWPRSDRQLDASKYPEHFTRALDSMDSVLALTAALLRGEAIQLRNDNDSGHDLQTGRALH